MSQSRKTWSTVKRITDIECYVIGHTFSVPTVRVTSYGNYSQYFLIEAITWYTFALYTSLGLDYDSLPDGNPIIEIELLCELPSVNGAQCVDSRVIEIEVLNVNDNPIKFENDSYYVTIPQNTTEGTAILTLTVFDGDFSTDTVIFSIINLNTYFMIDTNTGEILVASQLDHAQQDRFMLEIRAFQLSSKDEAFTSVTIILSDTNGKLNI